MHDCQRLLDAIERYIAKADEDLEEILEEEGFAEPEKTVKKISEIEDAVADVLIAETAFFLSYIERSLDLQTFAEKMWPGVKLDDETAVKLTEVFTEQLQEFMPDLIEPYIQRMDRDLTLTSISKKTTAWIESWSKELGDMMKLTSHTQLEDILKKDLADGVGIDKFIRDIQDSGIRNERWRARRVAVTESLRAHNVAQEEAIQQSPATESKKWVHTGTHRIKPRDNHVAMNGQTVLKSETFTLYGADGVVYHPRFPIDPILPASESVNCHCMHEGIVSEKILGLTLEERKRLQEEAIAEMDEAWYKELNDRNRAKAGIE